MKKRCLYTIALVSLTACTASQKVPTPAIDNPASSYCIQQGGTLDIIKDKAGDIGICHLPNGTQMEEWQLFRRDHPQT